MSPSRRYLLHRDGRDHGPFSRSELNFLWSEGRASGGDMVRPVDEPTAMLLREVVSASGEDRDEWTGAPIDLSETTEDSEPPTPPFEREETPALAEFRGSTAPLVAPSTIADHEAEDRAPLYVGHPSLWVYTGRLGLALLLAAAAIWLERHGDIPMMAAATGAGIVVATALMQRASCRYIITPLRIEVSRGLIISHSRELALTDIRSIEIHRNGPAALLNIGTIEFASSGSDRIEVVFRKVRRPGQIKRLIHDLQDYPDGDEAA